MTSEDVTLEWKMSKPAWPYWALDSPLQNMHYGDVHFGGIP